MSFDGQVLLLATTDESVGVTLPPFENESVKAHHIGTDFIRQFRQPSFRVKSSNWLLWPISLSAVHRFGTGSAYLYSSHNAGIRRKFHLRPSFEVTPVFGYAAWLG